MYLTTRFVYFGGGDKMNRKKIGKILMELRGDVTREEVSKGIGVSVSALQMYENGKCIPKKWN